MSVDSYDVSVTSIGAADDPAIPQPDGAPSIKLTGLTTFVTTKAAAYCFLPSVTAIKFIAGQG